MSAAIAFYQEWNDNELLQQANYGSTPKVRPSAGEQTTPTTRSPTTPRKKSLSGSNFTSSHTTSDTQPTTVAGDSTSQTGHAVNDTQGAVAGLGSNHPADHVMHDTQGRDVGGTQTSETDHTQIETQAMPAGLGPILADPLLGLLADVVDDLETVRIANENRLRTLTTPADRPDDDGICRGFGLTLDNPEVARIAALVDAIKANEDDAIKTLERNTRRIRSVNGPRGVRESVTNSWPVY